MAAAAILADLHLDTDTIIAAILHDVIEDTPTPKDQLAQRFGADVAEIVDGVTKLDQIKFKSREEAQAESFRKMLLAMVRDLRVVLVKLADRTHNMRTIEAMAVGRRRAVARETLEIYAPIAERLGLYDLKLELEDLGFAALYPQRYRVLERALRRARGNQKEFLKKIEQQLTAALMKNEIVSRVAAREKHLYSIYRKMQRKRSTLNEIVDVYGLRVVVDKADTCYRALGSVHSVFKPMPGRFKDYIAIPRVNGYQSLHTTLFGPNGVPIEVQIRTEDMNSVAQSGIAAHWRYKTGESVGSSQQERAREWLSRLVELQDGGSSSEEFLESVKVDLFPDKVYVFTPKGEILRLAQPRHGRRLRVLGTHRHRQSLRGRQGGSPPDAAAHGAAQWPDRGDHHGQGGDAQSVVGELRGDRQGAQRDPALSEGPAPLGRHRPGQAAAEPVAGGIPRVAGGCDRGADAVRRRRIRHEGHRRAVRAHRPGRATGAAGRPPAAALSPLRTAAARLPRPRPWPSPAPRACWSATPAAASRFQMIRSSRFCPAAAAWWCTARPVSMSRTTASIRRNGCL